MKYGQLILRMVAGGVLIYAGFMKAVGPAAEFAAILEAYKILPAFALTPFAIVLPYVEMWIGLFVLFGLYARQVSVLAMILFATFFMALISTFARGIDLVSCGCFGADSISPRVTFILDLLFFGCTLVIHRQSKIPLPYSLDNTLP